MPNRGDLVNLSDEKFSALPASERDALISRFVANSVPDSTSSLVHPEPSDFAR
jgi:hypothetical protein